MSIMKYVILSILGYWDGRGVGSSFFSIGFNKFLIICSFNDDGQSFQWSAKSKSDVYITQYSVDTKN